MLAASNLKTDEGVSLSPPPLYGQVNMAYSSLCVHAATVYISKCCLLVHRLTLASAMQNRMQQLHDGLVVMIE